MSNAALAIPGKSITLIVLGLITMLLGGAHAALGIGLIVVGDAMTKPLREGHPMYGIAVIFYWLFSQACG